MRATRQPLVLTVPLATAVDGAHVTVKSDDREPRDRQGDPAALRRRVNEALRHAGEHVAARDPRESTRRRGADFGGERHAMG